jgi:adenosine deaminase
MPSAGSDLAWITGLPKAEVHCHLEGCIEREMVSKAAARHGVDVPWGHGEPADERAVGEPAGHIGSLAELLSYLDFACALIDQRDELASIAYAASRHASASGTRYLDLIITPHHWTAWRGRLGEMVDALDAGWRAAEEDGLAPAGLCLSINRQQTASQAREMVEWMVSTRDARVVALSIDGNERLGSNNERFAEAFATAAAHGLRRCAHAGESSGPNGVRAAIELLGAERIDHGIRSVEDPALVGELVRRQVPLDICTTSNVILGLVPDLASHPVERLRAAGVRVSLNTDDPLIYGCHLSGEYSSTAAAFGWGRPELGAVARTSIEACFAEEGRKAAMLRTLDQYLTEGLGT